MGRLAGSARFQPKQLNPAYFARLRELASYAESKEIIVLITVHDGWPKTCFAGHCARFFNGGDVPFWEMEPNGKLASTGVCLADPGQQYVVYSAKGASFTVDLSVASNATMSVQWYNSRSGQYHAAVEIVAGDTSTEFTPPFPGDAVLRVFRNR